METQSDTEEQNITHKRDEEILSLSLSHPALYEVIVDRYEEAFKRKARKVLRTEEDVEDAVQETFVRIYTGAPRFKTVEGASFKSWGYKILMNTCFTHYQKKKKEEEFFSLLDLDDEFAEIIPDKDELHRMEAKINGEFALSLVSKLPEMLKRAITMYFIEERPQKEIAKLEGVSEGVIRTRIHRAKKELRKIMNSQN